MNEIKNGKEELNLQEFKVRVNEFLELLEFNLFSLLNGLLNEEKEELKPCERASFTNMAFIPFLKFSYVYAEEIDQKLKLLFNLIIYTDENLTEEEPKLLDLAEFDLNLKKLNDIVYNIASKIDAIAKYFGLTYETPLPSDCENQFRGFLDSILYHLQNANTMLLTINDYIKFEKPSLEEHE